MPAVPLAVKVDDVATPEALVTALEAPWNDPLAPLEGAVKVTVTPLTGLPDASMTVAWRGVANTVLTVVVCGVPPVAAIEAAAPGALVSEKVAGVVTPATDAVTE